MKDDQFVTWAVTLDFHNTIACCDDWFRIEVYDLIPAFFAWHETRCGIHTSRQTVEAGRRQYRKLRRQVMDTGDELDAEAALRMIVDWLDVKISDEAIERAAFEIFQPTLASTTPVTGVVDSVRQLSAAGMRMAVISSAAFHPFLEWTLEKFGIADCFEAILTSASTGYYKSTPKIYRAATEHLNVRPEHCIHIGDSEQFDVQPAASIGMSTVLYAHNGDADCARSTADLCIETLSCLPDQLRSRFGIPLEV